MKYSLEIQEYLTDILNLVYDRSPAVLVGLGTETFRWHLPTRVDPGDGICKYPISYIELPNGPHIPYEYINLP